MGRAHDTSSTCTDRAGKEMCCEDARGSFFEGEEKVFRWRGGRARERVTHFKVYKRIHTLWC